MPNERVITVWGSVTRSGVQSVTLWVVNFHQIWRTLYGSRTFLSSFNYNTRFWEFEVKRNSLKNTRPMYIVFIPFHFGEKSAGLKGSSSRLSSKSTGILRKIMEAENAMEKRLRVFRAHSRILL